MKRLILLFGTFATGVFLFFFLMKGIGWQDTWISLQTFSLMKGLVVLVLTGAFLFAGALRWYYIVRSQGGDAPFLGLLKTSLAGFSLLFFVPVFPFANELFRASALKEEYGMSFVKSTASVISDRILEVTSNLFVVMLGGVIFLTLGSHIAFSLRSIGVVLFIAIWFCLLSLVYIRIFQKKSIIRIFWRGNGMTREVEEEVFAFFQLTSWSFWQGITLSFVRSFLGLLRVWIIVLFFGKGLMVLPGITMLGFYYLGILVPIPAGLGAHDALQAVGFQSFGLGAGTGAAFALVIRANEVLFAGVGLALLFHFSVRIFRDKMFNRSMEFIRLFSHDK